MKTFPIFLLVLSVSLPAVAQEPPREGGASALEEIIVTATLREVRLEDLPLSVGVLTGEQLADMGAVSMDDWWREVPGLAVRDAAFGGNSVIIRGLADSDSFNSTESINAFYVDDTAMTHVTGLFTTPGDGTMLDVARVEVLRGPQGTLIGANSMGGAVRVITNDPDPVSRQGRLDLNAATTSHGDSSHGARFVWNQPTGEDSALRFAALYQDSGGFIDDVGLGDRDINDQRRSAARLSGLWTPADNLEVVARFYTEQIEQGGYNYADPFGRFWNGMPTSGEYQHVFYSRQPREEDLKLASLRLKWQTDWGEIYSATSWFEKDVYLEFDWSFELFFFFELDAPAPFWTGMDQRDFSQEIRFSSNGDGPLNWIAGIYYLDQDAFRHDFGEVPDFLGAILDITEDTRRTDKAVFGEVNWAPRDDIEAALGLRWYEIERDFISAGFFAVNNVDRSVSGSMDDVVAKASLSWDIDEQTMVYGLVSQGFRPGQFNNAASVDVCGSRVLIDSDNLTNYEFGVKHRGADGRLAFNATAYRIDWTDMQTNAFNAGCGFVVLDNVGKARSEGVEFDFQWLVSDSFSLRGGVGYTRAKLREALPDPSVDAPAGTRIPNVPKWSASLSGSWNFSWNPEVPGFLGVSVQHQPSRPISFDQSPDFGGLPYLEQLESYSLVNLGLGAIVGDWRVELIARNATEEYAQISCCRNFADPAVGRPRTIGVHASIEFD